jgi:spermidine/putrescine transport system permease protein
MKELEVIPSVQAISEIKHNPKQQRRKDRGPLWTLSPVVIWMVCFLAIPLLLVIAVSFLTRGTYGGIDFTFTLNNYVRIMDPLYVNILWNSLIISFFCTVLCLVFGYPFAYFVARSLIKYRSMLLMLIIVPFWTNSLIRTYAWIILLRTEGVINSYLMKLGIIAEPLALMYNNFSIGVGLVYTLFPFMVLPLYASIEKLDRSYLEAASDLGATPWRSFLKVTLPLTMPGIVSGSLLVFIPSLGLFFISDLMGGSKVMLIGNLIKNQFLTARDWPFGAAISIVLMIITFVLIALYLRIVGNKRDSEVL